MTEKDETNAVRAEEDIANRAKAIRGNAERITPALFDELWPLLCEPIHAAFLVETPVVKGKPYVSTGIRSVQVQVDRLNNVLGPRWWRLTAEFYDGGKVAEVTVAVGNADEEPLVVRDSRGGVDRGSTLGNLYKGSYTNAAKLAIARLGPGREVYVGLADPDPDVEPAHGETGETATIGEELAGKLYARAVKLKLVDRLQLTASHVAGRDVGACDDEASAVKSLGALTFDEARRLDERLTKRESERGGQDK